MVNDALTRGSSTGTSIPFAASSTSVSRAWCPAAPESLSAPARTTTCAPPTRSRRRLRLPPRSSSTRQLALDSGVPDRQIALRDAFEIDTPVVNGLLVRVGPGAAHTGAVPGLPDQVHASTRHMDGNLYRTHASRLLFNLVTVATGQGIQTIGVPTGESSPPMSTTASSVFRTSTMCSTQLAISARRSNSSAGASCRHAPRMCWRGAHELLPDGSPTSVCSRRSGKGSSVTFPDRSMRAAGPRESSGLNPTT